MVLMVADERPQGLCPAVGKQHVHEVALESAKHTAGLLVAMLSLSVHQLHCSEPPRPRARSRPNGPTP